MVDRQERTYLLREGHLLGYVTGLLMGAVGSRWLAAAWGLVVLALWLRSAVLSGSSTLGERS